MAKAKLSGDILPMPLAPLLTCPALIGAPGAVYRAVTCLAFTYWLSGCRPLPRDPAQLAALVRLSPGHMTPIRSAVDAAMAELFPVLKAEFDARYHSRSAQRAAALHASQVARSNGSRKGKSISADRQEARIHPTKAAPYAGNGRTDMHARSAAIEREAPPKPRESPWKIPARQPHQTPPPIPHDPARSGLLREGSAARRK